MKDIRHFDIATTVTDSLIDIFDIMLSMDLQLADDQTQRITEGERIVGSVSVAGKVAGSINIEVSKGFSHEMAGAMLDVEPDEIVEEDDVKDVIREMCNMVGGNLKSAFCDAGLTCEFSPPSFTTGNDFKIESLNTVRHERYVFSCNEHIIAVEVGIKGSEAAEGENDDAVKYALELQPVNIEQLKTFDIKTPVNDQLIEVFDMMLSMELKTSEEDLKSKLGKERLVGSVNLIGSLMGHLSIHVNKGFSHQMTAAMLGIELDEVVGEKDIKDMINELCNIVGGNLKSRFCDSGMTCEMATPSLTAGSNFKIESRNMARYDQFSFLCGDIPVVVEVVLKVVDLGEKEERDTAGTTAGNIVSQEDINVILKNESLLEGPAPVVMDDGSYNDNNRHETTSDAAVLDNQEELNFILDIPLDVVVEQGRNKIKINELYNMGPGSVVEFMKLAGESLDILVNGTLIAKGEVMVQGEKYGIRIVDILSRTERIGTML